MPSRRPGPVIGLVSFVEDPRGDPLRAYPSVTMGGRPFQLWLTENVLIPVLSRWAALGPNEPALAARLLHDFEWASSLVWESFEEIEVEAASLGEPAVLAATGVAANLQRTLAILAEFILHRDPRIRWRTRDLKPVFKMSRSWCGLIEYPKGSRYFSQAIHPPAHSARMAPLRRDLRHVANALWCSFSDIERECEYSLALLKDALQGDPNLRAEDIRHLHAHATPRPAQQRERRAS